MDFFPMPIIVSIHTLIRCALAQIGLMETETQLLHMKHPSSSGACRTGGLFPLPSSLLVIRVGDVKCHEDRNPCIYELIL